MNQHRRRVAWLFTFVAVTSSSPAFSLDWPQVAARIRTAYASTNARLADEAARAQVRTLAHPGSPTLSVAPGAKAITPVEDGELGEEIDYTATLTAKLPLGLSALQQEKLAFARDATGLSSLNAEKAEAEAYVDLYSRYQTAWLAQEERKVLRQELAAAVRNYENTEKLFKAGLATLTALKESDDDLNSAQIAALQGETRYSLAWLDLAFAAGLPERPEELGELSPHEADLPQLGALTAWATAKHPDVVSERTSVRQTGVTLERLGRGNFAVDVKAFFTSDKYSGSLGYDLANPEATGSFTFPAYIYGSIPEPASKSQVDTWSLGFSLGIAFTGEGSDRIASDAARNDLRRQELALQNTVQQVQLNLYGKYTVWDRAGDAVQRAERALGRIRDSLETVEAKRTIGQAGEYETMEAQALVARAEWNLKSARIDREKTRLAAAAAAFYLGELSEVKQALKGDVR
jgi:outer membrane protein TolC